MQLHIFLLYALRTLCELLSQPYQRLSFPPLLRNSGYRSGLTFSSGLKRETIVSTLANTHNPVLKTATNAFDFCTATCRTSSQSVIHHKTYRNDDQKYCFSSSSSLSGAPSIQESVFQSRRVSETSTSSPEEGVTSSPLRKKEADIASDRLKQREPRKLFNDHTNSLYNRVYGSSGHHLHSGCLLLPLLVSAMFIFFVASFCSLKDEERKEKSL